MDLYAASRREKEATQQANGGALGFDARVDLGKISTRNEVGENENVHVRYGGN